MEIINKGEQEFVVQFDGEPVLRATCNPESLRQYLRDHMLDEAARLLRETNEIINAGLEHSSPMSEIWDNVERVGEKQAKTYPAIHQFSEDLHLLDLYIHGEMPELSPESFSELNDFIDRASQLILSHMDLFLYGIIADTVEYGLIEAFAERKSDEGLRKVAVDSVGVFTRMICRYFTTQPTRHRPRNTATFDDKRLLMVIEEVIGSFSGRLRKPTQSEVLAKIRLHHAARKRNQDNIETENTKGAKSKDTKTLRNLLGRCGLTWDQALEKYWKPEAGNK